MLVDGVLPNEFPHFFLPVIVGQRLGAETSKDV